MFGFAKKIGMTRLFIDGRHAPVTVLQVDENFVSQRRTKEKDGYDAIQVVSFPRNTKSSSKARLGHLKKAELTESDYRCIGEFKGVDMPEDKKSVTVEDFKEGDKFDVTGISIGRGFTGAVKRWGFAGQMKSHGYDHVRRVGSIGDAGMQRVDKGKKMAGQHGASQDTVRNLKVVGVDLENKLVFVRGSVPGANGKFLKLKPSLTK